jgi:hypothetical protein
MDQVKTIWTHGCDACNADAPVEYVPPLGYLCAFCRRPESRSDLWREHREAWAEAESEE